MRLCGEHEFLSYVEKDDAFYAYPINMQDINKMPDSDKVKEEMKDNDGRKSERIASAKNLEEYWLASVGKTLYSKIVKNYTEKLWQVDSCTELDTFKWSPKGVQIKEGARAAWDNAISAYPLSKFGYDYYFEFSTRNANVLLNTRAEIKEIEKKLAIIDGSECKFDIIISTIGPDKLMNNRHGELMYNGRKLNLFVMPSEYVFPKNVYFLYYPNCEEFTRLVEYKKFTRHKSKNSLIGMEIPVINGGCDYPMPIKKEQIKCNYYFNDMPNGVFSMGRAGSYLYGVDIDDCIKQSMLLVENLKNDSQDHPVPGKQYRFPELNNIKAAWE